MKIRNEFWKLAAQISGSDTVSNDEAASILLAQVETLGWTYQNDPDIVTDPAGHGHYMHCYDLIHQAYEIIMLDADLKQLGML